MSTLLGIVQDMVLRSAFDFTCAAATKLFNKRIKSNVDTVESYSAPDVYKHEREPLHSECVPEAKVINIKVPDPAEKPNHFKLEEKPSIQEVESRCTIFDMQYKMIGPISPPKSSCMRLARDSYFS